MVADEKLGINLIEKSLVHKSSLLSCCFLDFVFGSRQFGCSVDLFETTLLVVRWASLLCMFLCFIKFGIFLAIICSSIFFLTLLCSPFVTPLMNMLVYLIVSHRSLKLCSFFFILFSFLLFRLSYFIFPPSSLILSSA